MIYITSAASIVVDGREPDSNLGTGYRETIQTRHQTLTDIFGPANGYSDKKTRAEWIIRTPVGVATIYDYKSDLPLQDETEWHVGAEHEKGAWWIRKAMRAWRP